MLYRQVNNKKQIKQQSKQSRKNYINMIIKNDSLYLIDML